MKDHVSPARSAAYEILRRVEADGAYAAVLLAGHADQLGREDRGLCYNLVLGCLSRQLWLDAFISYLTGSDKAEKLDAAVRIVLRLGLYQLRFLERVPDAAIVFESVSLVRLVRKTSASGLVNAVLRRAIREPEFDPAATVADPVARLAIETSHPQWLLERWIDQFGWEQARAFAVANNSSPATAIRPALRTTTRAEFVRALSSTGVAVTESKLVPDCWLADTGAGPLQRLVNDGMAYIQDEASQYAAQLLLRVTLNKSVESTESIIDLCAAPGSKASLIAMLMKPGSSLVICDLHEHRMRTAMDVVNRIGHGKTDSVLLDAAKPLPFSDSSFDRVLVDAPCSGTGTLRRNPEIRWRLKLADISLLAAQQSELINQAAQITSIGGVLVYSTCSVERAENEDVVAGFLAGNTEFQQIDAALEASNVPPNGSECMRFWPQIQGCDGFFVAAFRRMS